MKKDQHFLVIKPIPLGGEKYIPTDTEVNRIHGVYYMNGVIVTPDYQEDFDALIEHEEVHGWNYLVPVKIKTMYNNTKEGL